MEINNNGALFVSFLLGSLFGGTMIELAARIVGW